MMLVAHAGVTVVGATSGRVGQGNSQRQGLCGPEGPPAGSRQSFPRLSGKLAAENARRSHFWKGKFPLATELLSPGSSLSPRARVTGGRGGTVAQG